MTAHPIDTEALRASATEAIEAYGPAAWPDIRSADLLALLDLLAAAEHRATRAEAQSAIRGRAVVIYQARAREAEAERDWNLRSSRLAKEERIKATARADEAEARIKAWAQQYDYDMGHEVSRAEEAETRIRAVEDVLDRSRDDIAMHTYPEQLNADIRRALNGGQ